MEFDRRKPSEPANRNYSEVLEDPNQAALNGLALPAHSSESVEVSGSLGPTISCSPSFDTTVTSTDFLPNRQAQLAGKALSADEYATFSDAVRELVKIGGIDSVKALVCILSQAITGDGTLAKLSVGGRHVTVYELSKALLKTAGASKLSDYDGLIPEQELSSHDRRQVWNLIRALARGDHGDAETTMGVRGLLFERVAKTPVLGTVINVALRAAAFFDGAPSGSPPRLLFELYDLPWAIGSNHPSASADLRSNNLAEILYRGQKQQ